MPLNEFGKFITYNLRDRGINHYDLLAKGHWKAPSLQNLQNDLSKLTAEEPDIVRRCVVKVLDNALHDFLFALQEAHDNDEEINIVVDNENIASLSDGLHGEPFTEDGWIAKFGEHPESKE